jgi:hypothetical protein
MSSQRPYRNHSLDTLFLLAREHWENVLVLRLVLDELTCRTTAAAKDRHTEISRQVARLDAAADASKPRSGGDEREDLIRLRTETEAARRRIADLELALHHARDTIATLRLENAAASKRTGSPIFRRVGLDEGCPDFVLKAVRTAYRKTLHPDGRASHEKAEAEARFKQAEAVFDVLYALRNL